MRRRRFLVNVGLAGAASAGSGLVTGPIRRGARGSTFDPRQRPNILIILVDQLRSPRGPFDQERMDEAAPNLARLREASVAFDAHFAASTMCQPARASLVTGLYSHQTAVFLTGVGYPRGGILNTPPLNPGFPTWGTLLGRGLGYRTSWWGKWHASNDCDLRPFGFDEGGLPCPSPNGAAGEGQAEDPAIADLFIAWLEAAGGRGPWCSTVSFVNPHDVASWPTLTRLFAPDQKDPPPVFSALPENFETPDDLALQGKPRLQSALRRALDRYLGVMPFAGPRFPTLWLQLLDLYALATSLVDRQVGRVLDALEARPEVASRTIVLFTSDHGEYAGAHGLRNKGGAAYEEGIRVPLYVRDPTGVVIPPDQAGTSRSGLTSSVDLVPLLLTLASGGDAWRLLPRYEHLATRHDLAAMLRDPRAPGRPYVLHATDEALEDPTHHVIAYRTERAKLCLYSAWIPGSIDLVPVGQQAELYDYDADGEAELINRAPSNPDPRSHNLPLFSGLRRDLLSLAIPNELRRPLPPPLDRVHRRAVADHLAYRGPLSDGGWAALVGRRRDGRRPGRVAGRPPGGRAPASGLPSPAGPGTTP